MIQIHKRHDSHEDHDLEKASDDPSPHHGHKKSEKFEVVDALLCFPNFPTYSFNETPSYLRRKFILTGYRVDLPINRCIHSLFALHNESGNIWTHLIGFLIFLYCFQQALFSPEHELIFASFLDKLVFIIFLLAALGCMGLSTFYHLFSCHSHNLYNSLYRCDLLGISGLIAGSFVLGIHYGFSCFPNLRLTYFCLLGFIAVIGFSIPYVPSLMSSSMTRVRTTIYVLMVSGGVIPALHWYIISPAAEIDLYGSGIFFMFFFYAVGFIFFALRIPERWFPGVCDYFVHSHQIWHICVFLACFIYYQTCLSIFLLRTQIGCVLVDSS